MAKLKKSFKAPYERTRDFNSVSPYSCTIFNRLVDKTTGVVSVLENKTTVRNVTQTETMVDIVTPAWEEIQASGGIVNNPMSKVSRQYNSGVSGFAAVNDSPSFGSKQIYECSRIAPNLFGLPTGTPLTINVSNLQTYASVKALAGMKPSNFMGIVSLAEGKKTLAMLAHPLSSMNSLLKYVTQLRQAGKNLRISNTLNSITINGRVFPRHQPKWHGPGKIVKPPKGSIIVPIGSAISGTVLANNLGLRPLMMDINSLLKEIPKLHSAERLTSRSIQADRSKTTTQQTFVDSGIFSFPTTTVTDTTVTCRASILYEDTFDVPADFGMSVWDIPVAAWELIPYSFVLDYFLNLGDLIASLSGRTTHKILCESLVTTIDTVVTRTWNGTSSSVNTFKVTRAASGTDVVTTHEKSRSTNLATPTFAFKPLSQVFRPTVVQNLLSLTVQMLTNLGKPTRRVFY